MRFQAIRRLRRAARWFRNRIAGGALILLYHRVAALPSDPQLLCVAPARFAGHLELLRKHYRPLRLQELNEALHDPTFPHRGVVLTFDDGYADNLYHAKPLLERYEIPATVFVATGSIGRGREFWWDELERLLLQPGSLPETLQLGINGSNFQWELIRASHYTDDDYRRDSSWNVLERDDPSPRHRLYRSLCRLLLPITEGERARVLQEIAAWAGKGSEGRSTHRALSPDEVVRLAEGELVEIGAHAVTHSVLSALPPATQRSEILESRAQLEDMLRRPVSSFAYPYGGRSDYTDETVAMVREAGYACACSNFADLVWKGSDCFQLPRVVVRNWDGGEFTHLLEEWFGG